MDAAFEFLVNGLNMEFAINLVADRRSIPNGLFVDILTEKCQMLHRHIKASKDCLDVSGKYQWYDGYHQTV